MEGVQKSPNVCAFPAIIHKILCHKQMISILNCFILSTHHHQEKRWNRNCQFFLGQGTQTNCSQQTPCLLLCCVRKAWETFGKYANVLPHVSTAIVLSSARRCIKIYTHILKCMKMKISIFFASLWTVRCIYMFVHLDVGLVVTQISMNIMWTQDAMQQMMSWGVRMVKVGFQP